MKPFVSHSQAGQDRFVHALLPKADGRFVDIGCGHPIELSNTYALEQLGWDGMLVDSDAVIHTLCLQERRAIKLDSDARKTDWTLFLPTLGINPDYASIDVDEHTTDALCNLLGHGIRPHVATVEHDFYQRDDRLRILSRAAMLAVGYDLLCADVHSAGCCFEDWFVMPTLVPMNDAERFRSSGLDWQDVLRKGGAL